MVSLEFEYKLETGPDIPVFLIYHIADALYWTNKLSSRKNLTNIDKKKFKEEFKSTHFPVD